MQVWPLYAGLAGSALVSSWRSFEVRPVGIALVLSWAFSNGAQWLPVAERPAAYTVCEVMVMSMAFLAHVCGAGRAMVALVAVSIVSIGSNLYMAQLPAPTRSNVYNWEVVTNICFGAECLLVILPMAYARSCDWIAGRSGSVALHGRANGKAE